MNTHSTTQARDHVKPGDGLYSAVRAAFVRRQTSLSAWCLANGVKRQNAAKCLCGDWDGAKARDLRLAIVLAAGLDLEDLHGHPAE